jgi:hypothetical protein
MLRLGFVQCRLGLGNCLFPALLLLRSESFFLLPFALALPFGLLVFVGCLAGGLVVDFASRLLGRLRGSFLRLPSGIVVSEIRREGGVLGEPSVRPTGRRSTTPGLAMVAATTSGSVVSLAAP